MGCDIHIVLERKDSDGVWVGWKQLTYVNEAALTFAYDNAWSDNGVRIEHERPRWIGHILKQRHYGFFNALCGVRGEGSEFGYEPRGLPNNASRMTRMCLREEDENLHSHSWLTIRELVPCLAAHWGKAVEGKEPEQFVFERMANENGNLYLATKLLGEEIDGATVDEWRFVFAFDN